MSDDHVTPASRGSLIRVEQKVDDVTADLRSLTEALMGKPGLTDGVIAELKAGNKALQDQWIAFQVGCPSAVNGAITQANYKRTRTIITGVRSWWVTVAASIVAGIVVATMVYVFHLGLTVAK